MTIAGILALVAAISGGLLIILWLMAWLLKKAEPSIDREVQRSLKEPYTNPLWPDLSTRDRAKKIARGAGFLCFMVAGFYGVFVVMGSTTRSALLDASLFAAIGIGLMFCSRFAAISGLVLYVAEQVWAITHGGIPNPISLLWILALAQGVRASFAYHRLGADLDPENAAVQAEPPTSGRISSP
jgi:hypothetical protein